MKKLLKIPAVVLFSSAFYTWISYDEYISVTETLFPWLNFQGVFKQGANFFFVCIQAALGMLFWELPKGKKKEELKEGEE